MTNKMNDDYMAFLNSDKLAPSLEEETKKAIELKFANQLVKSKAQMMAFYFLISLFGYAVSLLICAQNTIGMTRLSHNIASHLHKLPHPYCAMLCGIVFTGTPFLISFFFLNHFQQRYLLYRLWWFVGSIPLLSTVVMLFAPLSVRHVGSINEDASMFLTDVSWMAVWAVSAVLTPYVLEGLVYLKIKRKNQRHLRDDVQF